MRLELFPPDPDTEPRHWVRHDQAFAMMLGPGSIEWGSKRSALEKFGYTAGDLALCHRHEGEWVGLNERAASAARYFRCGPDGQL
jgi:AraC family transcriptional regulator